MKIAVIGMGPGGWGMLSCAAEDAIAHAALLIGSRRLLDSLPGGCTGKRVEAIAPRAIVDAIDAFEAEGEAVACVLMSGDTGFYSGTTGLMPLLAGRDVEVIPGISSIQMLSARLCRPWQDWKLVSAHGRSCDPVSQVRAHSETFFLTGGEWLPQDICKALADAGLGGCMVSAGECLGTPDEHIECGTAEELAAHAFAPLVVLLVDNPEPDTAVFSGWSDEAFERGKAPMTKSEVRAAIISKLRLEKDDIVYDIGAGTGSVSVEAARLASEGHVYAVEFKDDACELVLRNAQRFHLGNLTLVRGKAPEALEQLPAPTTAFIGGSSGNLREIMELLLAKNPTVRIVASAIALETIAEATSAFSELGLWDVEVVQIGVSRAKELGSYHLLMAQNPIFLVSGTGVGEEDPHA